MRAVYLEEKNVFKMKQIPLPEPKKNELLIQVKSVGVCGSDVHYWEHGRIGKFIVEKPIILGHEMSGVVAGCGENTTGFQIGDRVVVEPGTPCWHCEYCKTGRYNLCSDIIFYATPPYDGALCEYVVHDSSLVFKIPDKISYDVATMTEPQAVGTAAVRRANLHLGERVIIYGAGIIGICAMLAARAAGAKDITMMDIRPDRLEIAKKLGCDYIINAQTHKTDSCLYDVAFECSGAASSLSDASRSVKPGGRIVLIGMGGESLMKVPMVDFIINQQDLISVFRYANSYESALGIIEKECDNLKPLITHRFSLDQTEDAFKAAKNDRNAVKVIIDIG